MEAAWFVTLQSLEWIETRTRFQCLSDSGLRQYVRSTPYAVLIRIDQGPAEHDPKAKKCLVRGEVLEGMGRHSITLGECYANLATPADVWRTDETGAIQWRSDAGDELSECSVRRSCLASNDAGSIAVFDRCADAVKQVSMHTSTFAEG